jgi:xanthine dehydrogenase accessory factor
MDKSPACFAFTLAQRDNCTMERLDIQVLEDACAWRQAGHAVTLFTVVETWGSAPRPPGALLAVREDGIVSGSVSGGCVEDDLIARTKAALNLPLPERSATPSLITYGVSKEEAARFGLPCGGTLRLVQEPLHDIGWMDTVLQRTAEHELVARTLTLSTGASVLSEGVRGQTMRFDGLTLTTLFGPRWRLLLIGAGQLSQAVAVVATALDFEVLVCDPREEYAHTLFDRPLPNVRRVLGMPDDVVRELQVDAHTAIVALTHDPKLDDMALMEALASDAFYVGALGSRRNQATRKQRLAEHFDLTTAQLDRLHGPVGLRIGARTPAEIAISILAEIIEVKNAGVAVPAAADSASCAVG